MKEGSANKIVLLAIVGVAVLTSITFVRQLVYPAAAQAHNWYHSEDVSWYCGNLCAGGGFTSSCGAGWIGGDDPCAPICPPTSNAFDFCVQACNWEECNWQNNVDYCDGTTPADECSDDADDHVYQWQLANCFC
jgi:hypothetical protein